MHTARSILAIVALLGASAAATAQDKYPSRPIEIIVPYAPGGGSDIMVRNMVKVIEQHKLVPVPIAVVNQAGGGGAIARTQFSQARPDGYTLGVMDPESGPPAAARRSASRTTGRTSPTSPSWSTT